MAKMPNLDTIYFQFLNRLFQDDAPANWAIRYGELFHELLTKEGAEKALDAVVDAALGGADVAVSIVSGVVSVNPLTWVAKPITATIEVASIAFDIEKLYALTDRGSARAYLEDANGYRFGDYPCTCPWTAGKITVGKNAYEGTEKCKQFMDFYKEQKDTSAANTAVSMTVVGLLYTGPRFFYDWLGSEPRAEREKFSKMLACRARPVITRNAQHRLVLTSASCTQAQAMIAIIVGELNLSKPSTQPKAYPKTFRAIHDIEGGWELIADKLW